MASDTLVSTGSGKGFSSGNTGHHAITWTNVDSLLESNILSSIRVMSC